MSGDVLTLNKVPLGKTAKVRELLSSGSMRRRLLDLGLIEGTSVKCLQKSPSGDPIAYMIRGAVIALRDEDSLKIIVEER
jgi:ferrous iron transport protein A